VLNFRPISALAVGRSRRQLTGFDAPYIAGRHGPVTGFVPLLWVSVLMRALPG
jgi:hypothetical protein